MNLTFHAIERPTISGPQQKAWLHSHLLRSAHGARMSSARSAVKACERVVALLGSSDKRESRGYRARVLGVVKGRPAGRLTARGAELGGGLCCAADYRGGAGGDRHLQGREMPASASGNTGGQTPPCRGVAATMPINNFEVERRLLRSPLTAHRSRRATQQTSRGAVLGGHLSNGAHGRRDAAGDQYRPLRACPPSAARSLGHRKPPAASMSVAP